ncbi:MAG: lycopene cyclase family protein, partial [Planctomycetota bacterium]
MSSASRPTPDAKHHRIAVVGAGCAGSSLAVEFAARGIDADVTLFDPAEPAADRTWCFWETTPHRFADAITKRWPRVTVRGGGTESTIDVGDTPYACVRASDFHRLAAEAIDASGCTVRRGVSVEAIRETDTGVELDLASHGATLGTEKFDFVFDGRPQRKLDAANESEPTLLQHFGGIELAVPAGTLDTSVATLMDFDVPQHDGAHFMYALPFASDRVLVESTFLTPKVGRGIDYEANAMTYAREVLG